MNSNNEIPQKVVVPVVRMSDVSKNVLAKVRGLLEVDKLIEILEALDGKEFTSYESVVIVISGILGDNNLKSILLFHIIASIYSFEIAEYLFPSLVP